MSEASTPITDAVADTTDQSSPGVKVQTTTTWISSSPDLTRTMRTMQLQVVRTNALPWVTLGIETDTTCDKIEKELNDIRDKTLAKDLQQPRKIELYGLEFPYYTL